MPCNNTVLRQHVCNFGQPDREYYWVCVNIARKMGYKAWIKAPLFKRPGDQMTGYQGFFMGVHADADLSDFWREVNNHIDY